MRKVVRFVIIFLVLLALSVGGFALYVWLGTSQAPAATIAEPKRQAQLQEHAAPTLDPSAPVGVSTQSITSPVAPGNNVVFVVKTKPTAACSIEVEYNKVKSTDSGLIPKTADDFGMVQWSWPVESSVPKGTWPVTITCQLDEKSGMLKQDLVVTDET